MYCREYSKVYRFLATYCNSQIRAFTAFIIPVGGFTVYMNVLHGPARLEELPSDREPEHFEYYRVFLTIALFITVLSCFQRLNAQLYCHLI